MLLEKKQTKTYTHIKKTHEEFEAVNILCFLEKECRWGLMLRPWGQQPPPKAGKRQPFAEGKGMH